MRLKKNKESLDDSLQRRRSSVRFEPSAVDTPQESAEFADKPAASSARASSSAAKSSQDDGPSYTERLLEAKRKARKK